MRVDDRAVPTIGGDRPAVEPWPAILHIGIERQPVVNYVYDDYTAQYDAPDGIFVYDDIQGWPYDRFDLWCRFHGLTVATGIADPDGLFTAGTVTMTLDNRDGQMSQYDAAGRLVDWAPGSPLDIWAHLNGQDWWLFSGEVTAWRELADGTVEVEAFDVFSRLNEPVDEWDPGVYGDTVTVRLGAICAEHGYTGPTRFDTGDVTLHSYLTTATPLEEMQAVAISDGGVLVVDADGTLTYRDRQWVLGRDDQTTIPTFSDNYCDAPHHVWEPELVTDDEAIVNKVTLSNVAEVTVSAVDDDSRLRYGPQSLVRSADQWVGAAQGQALADFLIVRRADHYLRLESFLLYLHDPRQDLWAAGIDRRLGDIVTWVHEQPTTTGVNLLVLNLVVAQVVHDITPDAWITTIATTRTIGNRVVLRYDRTPYDYDDPEAVYVL